MTNYVKLFRVLTDRDVEIPEEYVPILAVEVRGEPYLVCSKVVQKEDK